MDWEALEDHFVHPREGPALGEVVEDGSRCDARDVGVR